MVSCVAISRGRSPASRSVRLSTPEFDGPRRPQRHSHQHVMTSRLTEQPYGDETSLGAARQARHALPQILEDRDMARRASVAASNLVKRYDQVKALLDAAAASSKSDYGGAGRFWDDLDKLKEAKVYGVRMIAPEEKASCCSDESSSARSGLIRGLRGLAPFDGNRFPPLMWGGARVAETDIQFIAEWIDDGCPQDDHVLPLDVATSSISRAQVVDLAEFAVGDAATRRYAYRDGEPRQRANLDCLSDGEVDELRDAFRKIYDLDKIEEDRRNFNNQALIHQNHCQHGWERFLPWHRAYLYEFEQNLQDFKKDIMVPYWDWTMPQYRPDHPTKGWIIPQAFQAFLTAEAADKLIS